MRCTKNIRNTRIFQRRNSGSCCLSVSYLQLKINEKMLNEIIIMKKKLGKQYKILLNKPSSKVCEAIVN